MHQFVSRRRRCWKLLKEFDKEIELSEGHRADMLLDLAGLDRNERTMIQASIGNARDFEKIADALIVQHLRIHLREKSRKPVSIHKGKGEGKGEGNGKGEGEGKCKGKFRKRPGSYANIVDEDNYDAEEDYAFLGFENADAEPFKYPAYWSEEEDAYQAAKEE